VKEAMDGKEKIKRELLLSEHDVRYFFDKNAKQTYQLHKRDALNVQMWIKQIPKSMVLLQGEK
jgi:hypothetical protein